MYIHSEVHNAPPPGSRRLIAVTVAAKVFFLVSGENLEQRISVNKQVFIYWWSKN